MKKQDRWERMVYKNDFGVETSDTYVHAGMAIDFYRDAAIKLLRKEHAWVRRMVNAVSMIKFEEGSFRDGVRLACEEIEHRLKERSR